MREEVTAGVSFIVKLINRQQKLHHRRVEQFAEVLTSLLCLKYDGHWYPEDPSRGQAYRCIRLNPWQFVDEAMLQACIQSGLEYSRMPLPTEMTLWIDPYEVSCRLGENTSFFTVAQFAIPLGCLKDPVCKEPDTSDYHSEEASSENPSENSDDEALSLTGETPPAVQHRVQLDASSVSPGTQEMVWVSSFGFEVPQDCSVGCLPGCQEPGRSALCEESNVDPTEDCGADLRTGMLDKDLLLGHQEPVLLCKESEYPIQCCGLGSDAIAESSAELPESWMLDSDLHLGCQEPTSSVVLMSLAMDERLVLNQDLDSIAKPYEDLLSRSPRCLMLP